jgi:glycine cleavage system H protein
MTTPAALKYSKSDEWILVEGNIVTLGVTDYAQEQLSDVVFVEVTAGIGDEVSKNSTVATIESVKAAADVSLPVSGKIIAINEALSNAPEKINTDPYGEAWLLKAELKDPSELTALMDAKTYEEFCQTRSH